MIKRKYVVLSLLTLVSIVLGGLFYSNLVRAQNPTVTGYVSVPAAAFVPVNNTETTIIVGNGFSTLDPSGSAFVGPVQLPHGATIMNVTLYWRDLGAEDLMILLCRSNGTYAHAIAESNSSGDAGWGSSYFDTIEYNTVDNSQYAYALYVSLPRSTWFVSPEYMFLHAIFEYTLPAEAAVGGLWIPVDKFSLLAPYIALVSTIILAVSMSVAYIKYRKRQ